MNRRSFLKVTAGAAGLAVVTLPTLAENAEAARRFWALDRTMVAPRGLVYPEVIILPASDAWWLKPGMRLHIYQNWNSPVEVVEILSVLDERGTIHLRRH